MEFVLIQNLNEAISRGDTDMILATYKASSVSSVYETIKGIINRNLGQIARKAGVDDVKTFEELIFEYDKSKIREPFLRAYETGDFDLIIRIVRDSRTVYISNIVMEFIHELRWNVSGRYSQTATLIYYCLRKYRSNVVGAQKLRVLLAGWGRGYEPILEKLMQKLAEEYQSSFNIRDEEKRAIEDRVFKMILLASSGNENLLYTIRRTLRYDLSRYKEASEHMIRFYSSALE